MRLLKKLFALLSATAIVFCETPVPQNVSAEPETNDKRIMVSLGDSYSSGEGIEPFYDQDLISKQRLNTGYKDYVFTEDWLAHRSELAWSGQLTLPGVSGTMSDHRNENWFFEAVSGAEIKHLGVDESYLDKALEIINKKADKQLKSGEIEQVRKNAEQNSQSYLPKMVIWDKDNQQWEKTEPIKRVEFNKETQQFEQKNDWEWELKKKEKEVSLSRTYGSDWEYKKIAMPYQLDVFNDIEHGTVDYVTLTLSGNDIGFTDVVTQAFTSTYLINPNVLTDMLNSKLLLFDTKVKYYLYSAYAAIQEKAGEQAKIIVAGYPKLFDETNISWISDENREKINSYIPVFNKRIKQIVDDCRIYGGMNIYFVSVEEIFDGHGAYSDEEYINGIIIPLKPEDLDQSAFPPVSDYSIHPNEKGAKAYASAVRNKIDELEENGIISGSIYEDREQNWNISTYSKIEKITAVNIENQKKKEVYVNSSKNNNLEKNNNIHDEGGWNQLDSSNLVFYYGEDCICSTGYYEMVLPPGKYNFKVTYTDGSSYFVGKNGALETDDSKKANHKIIDVEAGAVLKNNDIYLEGNPVEFEWYLEPSVEAEDIIVLDNSFDVSRIDSKGSDKYSFIKNNGKYNFISYDGKIALSKWYNEPRIAEGGDMGVYSSFSGVYYTNYGEKEFSDEEENNWLNRGAFPDVYYVFPYDTGNSEIYHPVDIGNPQHWGHECTYNCDYSSAVLIQEAKVKTTKNNWADIDYNGKYGAAYNNKVTVSPIYDYGIMNVYNDMIALKSHDKWGYFNGRTGEQVIDFIADEFETDYYCESINDRYSESRPYTYSDGYVSIKSDKEWALYDEEGNIVIDYGNFDEIRPVHKGKAWVKDKKTGLWGVISLPRTWQEIYKAALIDFQNNGQYDDGSSFSGNGSRFDLYDVDGNGVPELFISHGIYGGAEVSIYTVSGNESNEMIHIGRNGEIMVNRDNSYIRGHYDHLGYQTEFIYQMNDLKCDDIIKMEHNNIDSIYSVDDTAVSKEVYEQNFHKYVGDIDWIVCGRKYSFNQINEDLNDLWRKR